MHDLGHFFLVWICTVQILRSLITAGKDLDDVSDLIGCVKGALPRTLGTSISLLIERKRKDRVVFILLMFTRSWYFSPKCSILVADTQYEYILIAALCAWLWVISRAWLQVSLAMGRQLLSLSSCFALLLCVLQRTTSSSSLAATWGRRRSTRSSRSSTLTMTERSTSSELTPPHVYD